MIFYFKLDKRALLDQERLIKFFHTYETDALQFPLNKLFQQHEKNRFKKMLFDLITGN